MSESRPGRSRGVTLIETMVVVSIIGLLIVAAMPAMSDWMRSTRVRNAGDTMLQGLLMARLEALRRNTDVTFWLVRDPAAETLSDACELSSSSPSWIVSLDDPTGACGKAPADDVAPRIIRRYAATEGSTGVNVNALGPANAAGATQVTFTNLGQVRPATPTYMPIQTIQLRLDGARRIDLQIAPGGAVRMCDVDVTSDSDPRKCQ